MVDVWCLMRKLLVEDTFRARKNGSTGQICVKKPHFWCKVFMLLQWLDVFKAGQSCTLHRSLLLCAFIPRCVTLWVSSARTHEETRLRAFSLKDTSAARFSFFFLYCHFSDIHTLQVRFNVVPLCAKHSPNYLDSFFFFSLFFFFGVAFISGPREWEK